MSTTLTVYALTRDLDRTRAFYEEALGVKAGARSGNWVPFKLGGATFALHAAGPDDDLSHFTVSFGVDDVDAATRRFGELGGAVLRGVADETFGRMSTVQDGDGRTVELVQY